ncbi:MAG: hypothetical protein K2J07_01945, partial [Muribaculaceae bacterium]|nr:hypothetical protein [Muribaculaceae bacterium]
VCGELAAECILAKTFIPGVDAEAMAKVVIEIAQLQENELKKASIAADKKAFHAINAEFNRSVSEIVKKMNSVLPAEQKELNKKLTKK